MSTAVRTVLLIGTNDHEYQRPPTGSCGHGAAQFRALVVATCQQEGVQAIAEEMSVEALEQHGVHQSICQQVADTLHLAHQYCDPSSQEREALGVVGDGDIKMKGFFANWDPQQVEAAIRKSYAIRERYWLEHLLQLDTWPVLFICGANHTAAFRALLQANGIVVHVLFTRWVSQ